VRLHQCKSILSKLNALHIALSHAAFHHNQHNQASPRPYNRRFYVPKSPQMFPNVPKSSGQNPQKSPKTPKCPKLALSGAFYHFPSRSMALHHHNQATQQHPLFRPHTTQNGSFPPPDIL
jgi:hypothetical protein